MNLTNIFPFIATLKSYKKANFKYDLMASLTTLVVIIPQCMACALIVGIPPVYGLYTAVISVLVSALFGSSEYLITSSTNALALLVALSIPKFMPPGMAPSGDNFFAMLFFLTFTVGLMQLLMGVFKFGKVLDYVSHSVMVGFMSGAGILIAIGQLPAFFGIKIAGYSEMFALEKMWHVVMHLKETNFYALAISLSTFVIIAVLRKFLPKLPSPFLAIVFASICVVLFGWADKVSLTPKFSSALPTFTIHDFSMILNRDLLLAAIPLAIVGLVEAVSISKSLAVKTGEDVDFNQEFRAQGITNIVASFFQGLVVSGSFSNTATNFMAGAKSRVSGILTGIFLALTLLVFSDLAAYIPLASLAGLMMYISYGLVKVKEIRHEVKIGGSDAYIILITLFSTLVFSLDEAVYIGVLISIILFLKSTNTASTKILVPSIRHEGMFKEREINWIDTHKSDILLVQFEGNLYFGCANDINFKLSKILDNSKGFVFRMKSVTNIDSTVLEIVKAFCKKVVDRGGTVVFSGLHTEVYDKLNKDGIFDVVGHENVVMARDYVLEASNIAVKMVHEKLESSGLI